jgi:hypothetical protein
MDTVIGLLGCVLLLAVPLGYVVVQTMLLRRWAGGWCLAAALTLPVWAAWATTFIHDVSLDPTSHNLFPFEILIGAVASLLYLGGLTAMHGVVKAVQA